MLLQPSVRPGALETQPLSQESALRWARGVQWWEGTPPSLGGLLRRVFSFLPPGDSATVQSGSPGRKSSWV